MRNARIPRLWGIDDIAAALDVPSTEVVRWCEGGAPTEGEPMPPPALLLNLGRTHLWRADDVLDWAIRTGRTRTLWLSTHRNQRRRFWPWLRRPEPGRVSAPS